MNKFEILTISKSEQNFKSNSKFEQLEKSKSEHFLKPNKFEI
jgi:hypothetical protein